MSNFIKKILFSSLAPAGATGAAGAGSTYVLIDSIGFADVNANIGVDNFLLGSFSYGGKILSSVMVKITQAFDVDTVATSVVVDTVTSSPFSSLIPSTGLRVRFADGNFTQNSANYNIDINTTDIILGGNTTGNVDIYVLFADMP